MDGPRVYYESARPRVDAVKRPELDEPLDQNFVRKNALDQAEELQCTLREAATHVSDEALRAWRAAHGRSPARVTGLLEPKGRFSLEAARARARGALDPRGARRARAARATLRALDAHVRARRAVSYTHLTLPTKA